MITREIKAKEIENKVNELCLRANVIIRPDVKNAIENTYKREKLPAPKNMLKILLDNARVARRVGLPLCQDTGLVTVFIEMGQDIHIIGGDLYSAVNRGVKAAYQKNNFRSSVVLDPVKRKGSTASGPAQVHVDLVKGKRFRMTVLPKGFGSENKNRIVMLLPTAGKDAIVDFCVETVTLAGPDACPPYFMGVGIGGTMETCALLSKKALLRPVHKESEHASVRSVEKMIFKKASSLGIGVMGLGGISTVLGVNVEIAPTHIAGCPVAVSLCCHSLRSASGNV